MSDNIILCVKVGDINNPQGMKDGMIIDYLDPQQWGYVPEPSEHARKCFSYIEVPRTWLSALPNLVAPICDGRYKDAHNVDGPIIKARRGMFDLDALEIKLGRTSLVSDLRSSASVEILNGSKLSLADIKDSDKFDERRVYDHNTVSSGDYTIGDKLDYETIAEALADMANLTGNIKFTVMGAIAETAQANSAIDDGGYQFRLTSYDDHWGDPTETDYLISLSQNNFGITPQLDGSGETLIDNLYVKTTGTLTDNYHAISLHNANRTGPVTVRKCLIDKGGQRGGGVTLGNPNASNLYIFNNVGWNQATAQGMFFFWDPPVSDKAFVENNVAIDCYYGFASNGNFAVVWRNNYAADCTACFHTVSTSKGYNNATDDTTGEDADFGTGSGNLSSQAAADCLKSTDPANAGFCDIKDDPVSSPLVGAGATTTAGRSSCIRGRWTPSGYGVSIGAAETSKTPPTTISPTTVSPTTASPTTVAPTTVAPATTVSPIIVAPLSLYNFRRRR